MSELSQLTPDQGVERAVKILLEQGWTKDGYYPNWTVFVLENFHADEPLEEEYDLLEMSGVWEAIFEYTAKEASDGELTAKFVATQDDGLAHDSEVYFIVFSLTDSGGNTRYFKREGWYASYDGGHLEDGVNREVFPQQVSVVEFKENR